LIKLLSFKFFLPKIFTYQNLKQKIC